MWLRVNVSIHERALVFVNERPTRYLRPGRNWVPERLIAFLPFGPRVRVKRLDLRQVTADLRPAELELVPAEDLRVLELGAGERALVRYWGVPMLWLGEGVHQVWTAERMSLRAVEGRARQVPVVGLEVLDVTGVEVRPLGREVVRVIRDHEYTEVTVPEGSVGFRFVDGALDAVLRAGRHAAWTVERRVTFTLLELRERTLQVTGQEVMTKDRVTLRLNLAAVYRVAEPRRVATVAREPEELVYLAMQMAAREAVAARTLDELLAERHDLGEAMAAEVARRAEAVGLRVDSFGLKDVILPGDMKALLNRVIEARKEAEANVILRREETAATRSLAQTARMLEENPLLLKLKELEAWRDLADKVGDVHVVLGREGLPALKLES